MKIRNLLKEDLKPIVEKYTFPWTTSEKTQSWWQHCLSQQQQGIRTVAIIEENSEILGYGSLLRESEYPFFMKKNIPEINAIWINVNHRKKGLATALIKWLENLAVKEKYTQIGIGVGLYADYGQAQRLYSRLGYIPVGKGITYKGEPAIAGQAYTLDDDLLMWLVKDII